MLIGARNAMMVGRGGGMPTARDYIADSPILLFDGIENYGYGKHDAGKIAYLNDPTKWNAKYSSFYTTDDALHGNYYQGNSSLTIVASITSDYTLEWVGMWNGATCALGTLYSGCLQFRDDNQTFFWYDSINRKYRSIPIAKDQRQSVVVQQEGYVCRVYANGQLRATLSSAALPTISFNSNYFPDANVNSRFETCAIRWHSRALSASEIAANYAVDKARFGLP